MVACKLLFTQGFLYQAVSSISRDHIERGNDLNSEECMRLMSRCLFCKISEKIRRTRLIVDHLCPPIDVRSRNANER